MPGSKKDVGVILVVAFVVMLLGLGVCKMMMGVVNKIVEVVVCVFFFLFEEVKFGV